MCYLYTNSEFDRNKCITSIYANEDPAWTAQSEKAIWGQKTFADHQYWCFQVNNCGSKRFFPNSPWTDRLNDETRFYDLSLKNFHNFKVTDIFVFSALDKISVVIAVGIRLSSCLARWMTWKAFRSSFAKFSTRVWMIVWKDRSVPRPGRNWDSQYRSHNRLKTTNPKIVSRLVPRPDLRPFLWPVAGEVPIPAPRLSQYQFKYRSEGGLKTSLSPKRTSPQKT